ncbi:acetyltransferase [Paenibacillus sp. Z6-24]
MDYILYGAGGHAKVIVDIVRAQGGHIIGLMDDHQTGEWQGIPILGGMNKMPQILAGYPEALWLIAIGDNRVRRMLTEQLGRFNVRWGTAIHPDAIIGSGTVIGEGSVLMPRVVINADTVIGKHVIINTAATVDHDNRIADYVHLSPGVHTAGNVTIDKGSHIGIAASLIPGVSVGCYSIIGASACVVYDIPDQVLAVGCPAKIIRNLE